MLPDDQPTLPTKPSDPSRNSQPGPWAAPSVEELQAELPQYEVLEILGRGGMGAVYKARQKSLNRLVAIKVLPPALVEGDGTFAERFQREAQTMGQLKHPAIVAVHDSGATNDGLLYYVMEFVDGTDVGRIIEERGRVETAEALRITRAVCEALAAAHERGVVHRDIKPSNVMLEADGQVKVADFGLARTQSAAEMLQTRSSVILGSPDFIAPEALKRSAAVDHRADIFGVGVMLYQMLTGELPRGMFKLPSRLVPGLDERLDAIICKAMEPDPADRQQSARELLGELEALNAPPPSKPAARKHMLWIAVVATVLVIAAVAVMMRSSNTDAKPESATEIEAPWQPVFNKPEDFAGKRATFKDGWAVLTDRPLTIGRDVRDGAVRATTRYRKSGVGSLAVRANQNGHVPILAFVSGEGRIVALNFWPDYQSKESQRREFELPKPLAEGEEFTMELSARGSEFRVSVNGVEVGKVLRDLPGITSGTMGVVPAVGATVEFKDIAWHEFPAGEPSR